MQIKYLAPLQSCQHQLVVLLSQWYGLQASERYEDIEEVDPIEDTAQQS